MPNGRANSSLPVRIFSLSFALGIMWVLLTPPQADSLTLPLACLMLLLLYCSGATIRCFSVGFLLGFSVTSVQFHTQLAAQIPSWLKGENLQVVGQVVGVPKHDERHTNFTFIIEELTLENKAAMSASQRQTLAQLQTARVKLSWYSFQGLSLKSGERWQFSVRLKPPNSLGNPGSFDYARWLFQQRIQGTGYVKNTDFAKRLNTATWSLDAFRLSSAQKLAKLESADDKVALVQGLSVGLSHQIDEPTWALLRQSGTAHLLAISGLHIGLVMAGTYSMVLIMLRLLRVPPMRFDRPTIAAMVGLSMAVIYAALAGFSLPTQRALLMLAVATVSIILRLHWPATTALLFALLTVLIIDAFSVLSAGFWLSFGTVAMLCYLHVGRINRRRFLVQALSSHLKLGFILLPASVWFFNQGALVAPLANAVAVPVVAMAVVPLSLLCLATAFFSPALANVFLVAAQTLLHWLLVFLEMLLNIPWAQLALYVPSAPVLVCLCAALLLLFAPKGTRLRWLSVPLFAPFLVANLVGNKIVGLEVHTLDVGQGLAVVIFTPNRTLLYDTGVKLTEQSSMYTRVIAPFLQAKGRRHIDTIIISHSDNDHAGGLEHALSQNNDASVYASDLSQLPVSSGTECRAGQTWQWDDVHFSFLHPAKGDFGDKNDQSCVLLIHYGRTRVLLTGDIELRGETKMLQRLTELPVNLLLAPHHGSSSSSSTAFLEKIRPEHVIFAAGHANKFGFPHEQVQMRYKLNGSIAYVTGSMGAISFSFDQSGVRKPPWHFWQKHRRFWRKDELPK